MEQENKERSEEENGQAQSLKQRLEDMRKRLEEKTAENKEMLRLLTREDRMRKEYPEHTQDDKPKGLFLADSNRKHIRLPTELEWNRPDNIYTVEHLANYIRDESLSNYDTITIMIGTNNIKHGENGMEVFEKIKMVTNNINQKTRAKVVIIQIPPITRPRSMEEAVQTTILNSAMTKLKNALVVETSEKL